VKVKDVGELRFQVKGEAAETIHHLFMAKLKGYITEKVYSEIRCRYKECIRMLNGLEKTLERKVPERERRWRLAEARAGYGVDDESFPQAVFPLTPETFMLTPETKYS
jgi:23S rRNA-intervening sequence protein